LSPQRRILLASTASSDAVKGLPAAYRGMLRDTYKLGLQLDLGSKRTARSKAAGETIESLQRKYKTLLVAVSRTALRRVWNRFATLAIGRVFEIVHDGRKGNDRNAEPAQHDLDPHYSPPICSRQ
jgi:hypothetical protein